MIPQNFAIAPSLFLPINSLLKKKGENEKTPKTLFKRNQEKRDTKNEKRHTTQQRKDETKKKK